MSRPTIDFQAQLIRAAHRAVIEATPGWDIVGVVQEVDAIQVRSLVRLTPDAGDTIVQFEISVHNGGDWPR